jgi:DNA-binding GntR family transcriptional regulator
MFSLLDEVRGSELWRDLRSKVRSLETQKVTVKQHSAIVDAIEAGKPEAAAAAMRAHLTTLMDNLRRSVADFGTAVPALAEL